MAARKVKLEKAKKLSTVVEAQRERPRREEAPLGVLMTKIMAQLSALGDEGFPFKVLGKLVEERLEAGNLGRLETSEIYLTIYKLRDRGLIEVAGKRSGGRGAPGSIYRLTPAGEKALDETVEFYRQMIKYVERSRERGRRK